MSGEVSGLRPDKAFVVVFASLATNCALRAVLSQEKQA